MGEEWPVAPGILSPGHVGPPWDHCNPTEPSDKKAVALFVAPHPHTPRPSPQTILPRLHIFASTASIAIAEEDKNGKPYPEHSPKKRQDVSTKNQQAVNKTPHLCASYAWRKEMNL